jgi:DNA-binding PadR family transcriptional regulator
MEIFPPDFARCSCSGKSLPRLIQPAIMAVLAREPLHGYRIMEALSQNIALCVPPPDPAGVYRLLKNLEQNGYVTGSRDDGRSGGPARQRYMLTEKGFACLRMWSHTLRQYQNSIAALIDFLDNSQLTV